MTGTTDATTSSRMLLARLNLIRFEVRVLLSQEWDPTSTRGTE